MIVNSAVNLEETFYEQFWSSVKPTLRGHYMYIYVSMVSMEKCAKVTYLECDKKCTVTKNLVYSTFKTDVTTANSLELITNQKHRRALAKIRGSNHNLRIESSTKLPEHLRICQYCSSNEVMKLRTKYTSSYLPIDIIQLQNI